MLYLDILQSGMPHFASSGHFVARRESVHPRRTLNHFVLLMGVEGEYPIAQSGTEYVLRPGDFMLLFADREHHGTAPSRGRQSHYWCHFQIDAPIVAEENETGIGEFGHLADTDKYNILFRQLIDAEYRSYTSPALQQAVCDAYIRILLHELANDLAIARALSNDQKQHLVVSVKEWIRLNCHRPLSVTQVAHQFGYHPDYLTALFRRSTGNTLCAYINYARIAKAKKLLISTNLHIKEIASEVGFADEHYFTRLFRRTEGTTPTKYRNVCSNIHFNSD